MAGFLSFHPFLFLHVSLIYYQSMLWFDTWERVRVGRENPGDSMSLDTSCRSWMVCFVQSWLVGWLVPLYNIGIFLVVYKYTMSLPG